MREHCVFAFFFAGLAAIALYAIEFIYLPKTRHLDRDAYLMGWIGYPGNTIDDTVLNSLGLTGDVPRTRSTNGTIRILTLGGSSLFNRRFTERLKTALDARSDRSIEVVGAAYRGHTTRSSVIKFDYLTDRYAFDFILVYHGINDTWANNVAPDDFETDYGHLDAWYVRNWVLEHSMLARDLYNKLGYRKPKRLNGRSAFRSVETFGANLEDLLTRILARGAVPLLVTFASCVPPDYRLERFLKGEVSYNNPDRYDPQAIEGWGPREKVLEGIERHNTITRELAAEFNVPLLDAAHAFGSDPVDFGDVCHFSEPGTDRFAGLLADFILLQNVDTQSADHADL
jgi:lysophospholipase L1-like esterase